MVWACSEKRRRIRRQESDGDGGAGEKKERKAKAEVPRGYVPHNVASRQHHSCTAPKVHNIMIV